VSQPLVKLTDYAVLKASRGTVHGGLPAKAVPLEREVYESVILVLTLAGCEVYRLSQVRASRQTAGLGDLWVFGPRDLFAWIEIKRPGGRLRPEQRLFRERCQARRIEHVVGGIEEIERLLVRWKLAEVRSDGGILLRSVRTRATIP